MKASGTVNVFCPQIQLHLPDAAIQAREDPSHSYTGCIHLHEACIILSANCQEIRLTKCRDQLCI